MPSGFFCFVSLLFLYLTHIVRLGTIVKLMSTPGESNFSQLTATQSLTIVNDCVKAVTSSTRQLDPSLALQLYGVNTAQNVTEVRANIVGDPNIGVRRFGFTLNGNALANVSPSTTIGQLSTLINSNAVPSE